MGWTIDVIPTPCASFADALETTPVREVPLGNPVIYCRAGNGWDRTQLRPEVVEQIEAAKADAVKKASKIKAAGVSASLHGHVELVEHDEDGERIGHADNGESYVVVEVAQHDADILAQHAEVAA